MGGAKNIWGWLVKRSGEGNIILFKLKTYFKIENKTF